MKNNKKYIPNTIPLSARIICGILALFFLLYALAEIAIGYTFVPVKRGGGILLSGLPTFFIAMGAICVAFVFITRILDHYDKRNNEESYKNSTNLLFKSSYILFYTAILIGMLEGLLISLGMNVLPNLNAIAGKNSINVEFSFFYIEIIEKLNKIGPGLFLVAVFLSVVLLIFDKMSPNGFQKSKIAASSLVALIFSILMITLISSDIQAGTVSFGINLRHKVSAATSPQVFNAVILTHIVVFIMFLAISTFGLIHVFQSSKYNKAKKRKGF